jgi:hypothetical protein
MTRKTQAIQPTGLGLLLALDLKTALAKKGEQLSLQCKTLVQRLTDSALIKVNLFDYLNFLHYSCRRISIEVK